MPCIPVRFILFMIPLGLLGHELSLDRPIPPDISVSPDRTVSPRFYDCVVHMCYLYPYHLYAIRFCVCALHIVYVYVFYIYPYHLVHGGSWVLLCLCVVCLCVFIPFSYVLRVCVCVCVRIIF